MGRQRRCGRLSSIRTEIHSSPTFGALLSSPPALESLLKRREELLDYRIVVLDTERWGLCNTTMLGSFLSDGHVSKGRA